MNLLKRNPRKALIFGLYILVTVLSLFFYLSLPALITAYALLTLILLAVFRVDAVSVLGNIYYGRGDKERAGKLFEYAISRNTKSPAAHLHYAVMLLRKGEAEKASTILDKALGLNVKPLTVKNIRLVKGSCLWAMGETDAAVAHLEKMRGDYEYVNAQVLSTLGFLYFAKGDDEKAEALSLAAIDDTPSTAAAWDNLGQIYYKKNDLPKAREAFEKAIEHKPDLPDSLYFLGLIAKQSDSENALNTANDFFSRALACEITPLNTVTRAQIEKELTPSL